MKYLLFLVNVLGGSRTMVGLCLFVLGFVGSGSAEIRINEILATTREEDEYGTALEWVEIYNAGPDAVNLVDYTLTDDPQNPRKWNFPSYTLLANQFFLVLATGYDYYNPGEYHANFRLDADGEFLGLYRAEDLTLVDSITYPAQERDISFGRDPNNSERWLYFAPTPNAINSSEGVVGTAPVPEFSITGGVYDSGIVVTLSSPEDFLIRYTLDGTEPIVGSALYTEPLSIDRTTPLRARTFREGYSPSAIITQTYFIGEERRLAKLSIVTAPDNLWNRQKGIYSNPSQHGFDWERPASMEYLRPDGIRWFGVDAGLRLHGGASRTKSEKKSFRVYFRNEYGPGKLKLPVIPTTPVENFDSFILRAGFNDSWVHWDDIERKVAVYISDQLGRDVHRDMGAVSSHGIFTELYLNGEYWGLYNLCERYDSDFLESYYGHPEWDIISDDSVVEGDLTEWNRLSNFVSRNDLRIEENYRQVLEMIDVEEITSYYILNIWVQNHDWPHHNWYAARERRSDGKWKFLVWDIEDSFGSGASRGSYNLNTFTVAQQGGILGTIFNKLLQNDSYKLYFRERLEYYLETVLNPTHLLPRLDELADQVRDAMPYEAQRWNTTKSMQDWEDALEIARTFIRNRTNYIVGKIYPSLNLPTPTPTALLPTTTPTPPRPTPTPGGPTPTPTVTPTPTSTPIPTNPTGQWGIFDAHADIGSVAAVGDASYDPHTGLYTVMGSGWDIWGNADACHFLYKEIIGNFVLEATLDGENLGTNNWAKITLMARETLNADARHFACRVQESTFQASSQWRLNTGGSADSTASNVRVNLNRENCRLRLERNGDRFETSYWMESANQWTPIDAESVSLDDPIYVGFAVTSHDDGQYAKGYYQNVVLTGPHVAVRQWMMY